MRTQLRPVGNSSAVIIPKRFLVQLGLKAGAELDLVLDGDRVVITAAPAHPRAGWEEAAAAIAAAGEEPLEGWCDFGNADDETLTW